MLPIIITFYPMFLSNKFRKEFKFEKLAYWLSYVIRFCTSLISLSPETEVILIESLDISFYRKVNFSIHYTRGYGEILYPKKMAFIWCRIKIFAEASFSELWWWYLFVLLWGAYSCWEKRINVNLIATYLLNTSNFQTYH